MNTRKRTKKTPDNTLQRDYAVHMQKAHVLVNLCHFHLMQGGQEMFVANPAANQQEVNLLRNSDTLEDINF